MQRKEGLEAGLRPVTLCDPTSMTAGGDPPPLILSFLVWTQGAHLSTRSPGASLSDSDPELQRPCPRDTGGSQEPEAGFRGYG